MYGLEISQLVGLALIVIGGLLGAPTVISQVKRFFPARSNGENAVVEVEYDLLDWYAMVSALQTRCEELGHQTAADRLGELYQILRHPAEEKPSE